MEQVLVKLAEGASAGSWPAAFVLAAMALAGAVAVGAIALAWASAITA